MDYKNKKDASTKEETTVSEELKRSPVKVIREGDVSASIFAREHAFKGETRTFYSISFTRSYKDVNGRYQYTKSFDSEDLGKLVAVAQEASEFIHALPDSEPEALVR